MVFRLFATLVVPLGLGSCFKSAAPESGDTRPGDSNETERSSLGQTTDSAPSSTEPESTDRSTTSVRVPVNHRPEAETCDSVRDVEEPSSTSEWDACSAHADCTEGENGRCTPSREGYYCTYDECFDDGDCDDKMVCECGGGILENRCLREGNCRVDADCGPDGFCSPTLGSCGSYGGIVGYYCHTPDDECLDDSNCGDTEYGMPYCAYNMVSGRWTCSDVHCVG